MTLEFEVKKAKADGELQYGIFGYDKETPIWAIGFTYGKHETLSISTLDCYIVDVPDVDIALVELISVVGSLENKPMVPTNAEVAIQLMQAIQLTERELTVSYK